MLHKDGETSTDEQSACQKASAMFQISMAASLSARNSSASGYVKGDSTDAAFGGVFEAGSQAARLPFTAQPQTFPALEAERYRRNKPLLGM